jgi:hypothetical protein
MRIFSFFNRHGRLAALVDAYVDGELRGAELAAFEAHHPACASCSRVIGEARTLKASLSALPSVEVPRSFRLTPAMVGQSRPVPVNARAPLYLGLARAGAALSVVAFASVVAFSTFGSSSDGESDASTASRQANTDLQYDAAGANPSANEPEKLVPAAATQAGLPPATGGQVVSSGIPTVVPEGTPAAPDSGSDDRAGAEQPIADGGSSESGPPTEALSSIDLDSGAEESGSGLGAVGWFGILAAAAVLLLLVLEGSRRLRAKR